MDALRTRTLAGRRAYIVRTPALPVIAVPSGPMNTAFFAYGALSAAGSPETIERLQSLFALSMNGAAEARVWLCQVGAAASSKGAAARTYILRITHHLPGLMTRCWPLVRAPSRVSRG